MGLGIAYQVEKLVEREQMTPQAAADLRSASPHLQRQILEICNKNRDRKGGCGLEISTPSGTGPKGR